MTITRQHRDQTITFECDQCGAEHVADTDDFHDALAEFKDTGGQVRQECGEWLHLCATCRD